MDRNRYGQNKILYKDGTINTPELALPGGADAKGSNNLPHIRSIAAGINKYDPVHRSIFEVYFKLPETIAGMFQEDSLLLTQQVTKVGGLDVLQKTTAAGEQKFFGVTVSYLQPTLDTTAAEITMTLNLNLRQSVDNYVLRIFKAWENLSYDLSDGTRGIKSDYISDSIQVAEANRNGDVWRSYEFKHVMLTGVSGLGDLDYSNNDAASLEVAFRADYWNDTMASAPATTVPGQG